MAAEEPKDVQKAIAPQLAKLQKKLPVFHVSYFIGRCNPPHRGHIDTLMTMLSDVVEKQKEGGFAKALILLGSGPKNQGVREQTSSDPLPFELKHEFVASKLVEELTKVYQTEIVLNDICDIKEMGHPFGDVCQFVEMCIQEESVVGHSSVHISQYAGDKGDDGQKLRSVLQAAEECAMTTMKDLVELEMLDRVIPVTTGTIAVEPTVGADTTSMSATYARELVYLKDDNARWNDEMGPFYGEFSDPIYQVVLEKKAEYLDKKEKEVLKRTVEAAATLDYGSPEKRTPKKSRKGGGRKNKTKKLTGLSRTRQKPPTF